jgi:hypothetical protein
MGEIASTLQTGGLGITYEDDVVAYLALCLLCAKHPFDPTLGKIEKLELQMRANGWKFDDILLTMANGEEVFKIGFSVKSNHHIKTSGISSGLKQLLWEQFLDQEGNPFDPDKDYCGLIQPPLSVRLASDVNTIIEQGHQQEPATLFEKNQKTKANSKAKLAIYNSFKCPQNLFVSSGLEEFQSVLMLSRFLFVPMDFDANPSSSMRKALDCCGELLLHPTAEEQVKLFAYLRSKIRNLAPYGGYLDRAKLIRILIPFFELKDFPAFKSDWQRIEERTASSTGILQDTIGGQVSFSRVNELTQIENNFKANTICILTGNSGTGKTVTAKIFVQSVQYLANVIWLDATDFELNNVGFSLGLEHSLEDLITKGTTKKSYLVVDGPEKLRTAEQLNRLAKLLLTAQQPSDNTWNILVTVPSDSLGEFIANMWRRNVGIAKDALVNIGNITSGDTGILIEKFPELVRLMLDDKFLEIICNLKLLDKLTYNLSAIIVDAGERVTETSIIDLIWREEIEKMGVKYPLFMMSLAEKQADSVSLSIESSDFNSSDLDPVDDMIQKGFIRFKDGRLSFLHDLYGDWARYKSLLSKKDKFNAFIEEKSVSTILWQRAIQLYALSLLEKDDDGNAWLKLFSSLTGSDTKGIIIQDVFLTPLFTASHSVVNLERHKYFLFNNSGEYLKRLLDLFLIKGTTSNPEIMEILQKLGMPSEKGLDVDRLPLYQYWPGMIGFVGDNLVQITEMAEIALSKMVFIWLKHSPTFLYREEVAKIAIHLVRKINTKNNYYPEGEIKDAKQKAIKAMLFGFVEARDTVRELSLKLAGRDPWLLKNSIENKGYTPRWPDGPTHRINEEFRKVCLEGDTLIPMFLIEPKLATELLLACIIDEPDDISPFHHRADDGNLFLLKDFDYNTPFYLRGPFSNFLKYNPLEAITFVCRLGDFCTERFMEKNYNDSAKIGVEIEVGNEIKFFLGDYRVFGWHKDSSSGGAPDIFISILMSLENFLYEKLELGTDVRPYLEHALTQSHSLAIAGLVMVVGKSQPALFDDAITSLLSNVLLVYYDRMYISRFDIRSYLDFPRSWYEQKQKWDNRSQRYIPIVDMVIERFIKEADYRQAFEPVLAAWKVQADRQKDDFYLRRYADELFQSFNIDHYEQIWEDGILQGYRAKPLPQTKTRQKRKKKSILEDHQYDDYLELHAIRENKLLSIADCEKYFNSLKVLVEHWQATGPFKNDPKDYHSPYTTMSAVASRLVFSGSIWQGDHPEYWSFLSQTILSVLTERFKELKKSHGHGTGHDWHSFLCMAAPSLYFRDTQLIEHRKIISMCLLLFNTDSTQKVIEYGAKLKEWTEPAFVGLQILLLKYCLGSIPYEPDSEEELNSLIEDFVNGIIPSTPLDWESLARPEVRLYKGRNRRHIEEENNPDYSRLAKAQNSYLLAFFKALPTTLETFNSSDQKLIYGYWKKGIAHMTYQMGTIVTDGAKIDDFPDELSRHILAKLWKIVFSITREADQDALWEPILQYGYIGEDFVELLMKAFYLSNLENSQNYPLMSVLLHRMVEFTKGLETWKANRYFGRKDFRLCLYGLAPDMVGIWTDDFSGFIQKSHTLYSLYLSRAKQNPYIALALLTFLPTPSGIFFLFKGLYVLHLFFGLEKILSENKREGMVYMGIPAHERKLEDCLLTLWHNYVNRVTEKKTLVVFRLLVEYLVSRRSAIGIEIQNAMIAEL